VDGAEEFFSSKHSADEYFVGVPKGCYPINQATIIGKKHMDPYKNPIQ
jgi:hypothetical protein